MKLNYKKILFEDFFVFQLMIIMLAFRDYSNLSIISQAVSIVVILFSELKNNEFHINILNAKYLIFKLLFIAWCLVSVLWSVNSSTVINTCVTLILRMLTGFSIILYLNSEERYKKIIYMMTVASLILCIRLFLVVPISSWGKIRIGNLLSHDSNNSYGNTGITYVLGFTIVYLMVDKNIIKNNKVRYLLILLFIIVSLLSGSKKQLFLLVITLAMLTFFNSKNVVGLLKNCFLTLICISAGLFLIFNNQYLYNIIGSRFESFTTIFLKNELTATDASTLSRILYIKDALSKFSQNPFTGVGIDCYRFVNSYRLVWAENNMVELLADIGIFGLMFYYILPLVVFFDVIKRIKHRNVNDILLFILLVCFFMIDLSMVSYANNTLQLNFSIVYALNCIQEKRRKIVQ